MTQFSQHGVLRSQRGAVLITALLFAALLAIALGTYLTLSRSGLSVAERAFSQNDAHNLAEAGLEEALFCFRKVNAGGSSQVVWAAWTMNGPDATYQLPAFNRDSRGVGTVKVYVHGYDGSVVAPYILSQATIIPLDGSPLIRKTLRLTLRNGGYFLYGLVGIQGLQWNGHPTADSFNSNPSGSATGPWTSYASSTPGSNTSVIVHGGHVDLGAQGVVKGNLSIGAGLSSPSASQVTGAISRVPLKAYPMPVYPTAASVSASYDLGSSVPATLPVSGHTPALDGRFYYFCNGATIGSTSITAGKSVVIVGTGTSMGAGLSVAATATCKIYIDGAVTASGNGAINNSNWAGALQIFTSTTDACTIGGNGVIYVCFYGPNAPLTGNGGGNSGMLVGSFIAKTITSNGHMDFHYDEALKLLPGAGWKGASWYYFQSDADRSAIPTLSNGFLQ